MTMPPQILFLDIDGPLVPARALLLPGNGFRRYGWVFDPAAVAMINFFEWACPNLEVVLSSHRWNDPMIPSPSTKWTTTARRGFWEEHFEEQGLKVRFHEDWITPRQMTHDGVYFKRSKALEVGDWLKLHPEVKQFATLEDDLYAGDYVDDRLRRKFHLVGESYNDGLTWHDFKKMCRYLMVPEDKYLEYTQKVLLAA